MMGPRRHFQPKLFYTAVNLDERIPAGHPLRQVREGVDFNFVRLLVKDRYGRRGHESLDPAVVLKLMFLLFYENIPSERALMERMPLRLDWLWFCGYDLEDKLPDHSVLSKARSRWGVAAFQGFFEQILSQCVSAGLVAGGVVHFDSSLVSANADKGKLQVALRLVGRSLYEQLDQAEPGPAGGGASASPLAPEAAVVSTSEPIVPEAGPPAGEPVPGTKVTPVDPEARLTRKYGKTVLGYKDHRAVDDAHGIITGTLTTDAAQDDGSQLMPLIEAHEHHTDQKVRAAAADMAYGTAENYRALENKGIMACIPHQARGQAKGKLSAVAFTYDPGRDIYICPEDRELRRMGGLYEGRRYRYRAEACAACPIRSLCTDSERGRTLDRHVAQDVIDRAEAALSPGTRKALLRRRKIRAEGSFADAAGRHGFKQARWRGQMKVTIQNLLIAAIQNLRKLLKIRPKKDAGPALPMATGLFFSKKPNPGGRFGYFKTSETQKPTVRRFTALRRILEGCFA